MIYKYALVKTYKIQSILSFLFGKKIVPVVIPAISFGDRQSIRLDYWFYTYQLSAQRLHWFLLTLLARLTGLSMYAQKPPADEAIVHRSIRRYLWSSCVLAIDFASAHYICQDRRHHKPSNQSKHKR